MHKDSDYIKRFEENSKQILRAILKEYGKIKGSMLTQCQNKSAFHSPSRIQIYIRLAEKFVQSFFIISYRIIIIFIAVPPSSETIHRGKCDN